MLWNLLTIPDVMAGGHPKATAGWRARTTSRHSDGSIHLGFDGPGTTLFPFLVSNLHLRQDLRAVAFP